MSQSDSSMASRSCSTTTTVLPMSRRCCEGGQQLAVVPLVQADGGLVEDVDDAGQLAADLAGQADALALAAGERRRRPVQGQVAEAHVEQEPQPRADLLQQLGGDLGLGALEVELVEEGVGGRPRRGR